MEYRMIRGGHKDLHRIYPMLEADFREFERIRQIHLHQAFLNGAAELLLLKNESGVETGYAVVYKKSLYGYAMLPYFAVYPTMRGQGAGKKFFEQIRNRYAEYQGILSEVPEKDPSTAVIRRAFYFSRGFSDAGFLYNVGGVETALMYLQLKGPAFIGPAAPLIIRDIYLQVIPERIYEKHVKMNRI